MSNMKFNVTRKQAVENILTYCEENEITFEDDTLAVLKRMSETLTGKPRAKTESSAHKQNVGLLIKAYDMILAAGEEGISSRELAYGMPNFPINNEGQPSTNKAAAVLVQGVNEGFKLEDGTHIRLKLVPKAKKNQPARYAIA